MTKNNIVHVAVAVIKNSEGQYFIAKRPEKSHQGGLWEFPGGKVENNESVFDALKRELFEEIGINILNADPLIQIHHDYGDKKVFLDVFNIDKFSGEAFGKEGQDILWINENDFSLYEFPFANNSIITALQLPDKYMITGEFNNEYELLTCVRSGLDKNIKLIQFRAPDLDNDIYFKYAKKLFLVCEKENAILLLNTSYEYFNKHHARKFSHGIHLNSKEIKLFTSDNKSERLLISTSIHNHEELFVAEEKNVDFIVLSPVKKTLSHPDSIPLGWEKFKAVTEQAKIPVYALGGMTANDLIIAKENGGQGISAISEFWCL